MNEVAWSSSPNDEWNLLNLRPVTLRFIYCDKAYWGTDALKPEGLKKRRQKHRKLTRQGIRPMPRRTEEYKGPEEERERVRERRRKNAPKVGEAAIRFSLEEADRQRLHQQLDELLDNYELDPGTVDRLGIKKVTAWEMGYKDNDGEAQSHPLYGIQLEADPRKFEPEWPPVTRVESQKIGRKERGEKLTLPKTDIISDLQWPFVDRDALDVTCQILRDRQPDTLIIGGDLMDLSAWSKYQQMPEWATVTQQSIIEIHQFLAQLRKMLPSARIVVVEGNHEKRMPDMLLNNAKAAYGLKRADEPESWPVLSIPYLTAMDKLDIEYLDGFPANTLWLTPDLQFKHRTKGRGPSAVAGNERYSTVYGDNHRIESQYRTYPTHEGAKTYGVFGIGCLCRLDGHVPSVNSGRHLDGQPVDSFGENWQQGFMVIDHHPDGSFNANQIFIDTFNGYKAVYNGKVYTPRNPA